MSEKEQVIKALEEERSNQATTKQTIREKVLEEAKQEAMTFIVDFRMHFRCFALFMITWARPFWCRFDMEGYNVPDPVDESTQVKKQGAKGDLIEKAKGDF